MAETPNDSFETENTPYPSSGSSSASSLSGSSSSSGSWRRGGRREAAWLDELDAILDDESQMDAKALREKLRDQLMQARGSLSEAVDTATGAASGYVRRAVDCADVYVETRPWHAVSCAAGIGFLLGMLCSRR
jgi:ElaB/YqjD/DUF883 family membrane-anchored ribosome-binding protein